MNRILGKKKLAEEKATKDGRGWRKQKKLPEATKSQVDLSTALPALDDFRTSLIMPNLSARFSMLREQDNPTSKIGKASDDSVLVPRRKSRLHDLDLDIPASTSREVVEPTASKPSLDRPWPPTKEHVSFASDQSAGSDSNSDPSMMNRARPTEGNVLFGGRQKMYRLPSGGHSKTNVLGKLPYSKEVATSSYQRHRQDQASVAAHSVIDFEAHTDAESVSAGSAPGTNVETASFRTSQPAEETQPLRKTSASLRSQRSGDSSVPSQTQSTAPTSIHSQPPAALPSAQSPIPAMPKPLGVPERSLTKRRLYEQGLDQHMYEQQTNALTRLNSVHQQQSRSKSPPAALNATAFGTTTEPGMASSSSSRPQSPNTLLPMNTFGSLRATASGGSTPITNPQSPSFFVNGEYDEYSVLAATVAPSDRGKATAMGAFNKPKQQFDEEQYLQRLQQLQNSQVASEPATHDGVLRAPRPVSDNAPVEEPHVEDEGKMSPSQMSERAFAVFQSAASAMRSVQSSPNPNASPRADDSGFEDANKTFHKTNEDNQPRSAVDSPQARAKEYSPNVPARQFHLPHVQPAALENTPQRTPPTVFPEITEEDEDDVSAIDSRASQAMNPSEYRKPQALGGLVHQHLRNSSEQSSVGFEHERNASSQSSVYYNSSNRASDANQNSVYAPDTPRQTVNKHTNSNPWDIDDFASSYYYDKRRSAREDQTRQVDLDVQQIPEPQPVDPPAWQAELKFQHTRDTSTGTIQEREAFANELAARQKAIQAKMKGITEVESRATSPMPAASGASKALNMLRSVSSREVMTKHDPQREPQPKAMKLLGLSTTNLNSHPELNDAELQDTPIERTQAVVRQGLRARGDSESSVMGPARLVTTATSNQSRARSSSVASGAGDGTRAAPVGTGAPTVRRPDIPPAPSRPGQPRRSPLAMDGTSLLPQTSKHIEAPSPRSAENYGQSQLLSPISTRVGARSASGPATSNSAGVSPITPHSGTFSGLNSPKEYGVSVVSPQHPHIKSNANNTKRRNVTKFDISEPVLISSTSNVETVDLPAGASLRNGDPLTAQQPTSKPRRKGTLRIFQRFGHDGASEMEQAISPDSVSKQSPAVPQMLSSNGQYSATQGASPVSPFESVAMSPAGGVQSPQRPSPMPSPAASRKPSLAGQEITSLPGSPTSPERRKHTPILGPSQPTPTPKPVGRVGAEGGMF